MSTFELAEETEELEEEYFSELNDLKHNLNLYKFLRHMIKKIK